MKTLLLPVVDDWKCKRSGDCCRLPPEVIMTAQERDLLQEWADSNLTMGELSKVRFSERDGFVVMKAGPCPFLKFSSGVAECSVHTIRPYNCRRFGCQRPDPAREPYRGAPLNPGVEFGGIGCANLRVRLIQSRVARRVYGRMQRKAQAWAYKMGWTR